MITEKVYHEMIDAIDGRMNEIHEDLQAIYARCQEGMYRDSREFIKGKAAHALGRSQKNYSDLRSLRGARMDYGDETFESKFGDKLEESFHDDNWSTECYLCGTKLHLLDDHPNKLLDHYFCDGCAEKIISDQ